MCSNSSRIEDIFLTALETKAPAERTMFLDRVCGIDAELRRQVDRLLAAHPLMAVDFMSRPALERHALDRTDTASLIQTCRMDSASAAPGEDTVDDDLSGMLLSFLSPATRPGSLGRIGRYDVQENISIGGFSIVFRAFDESLERMVAVKVLAPKLAVTASARKRFLREARASAMIRHDNIVQVYSVEEQPFPCIVMEFIPGETLQQRLDRAGALEPLEVAEIGRQIALGLAAAHAQKLIHRDIKPANIMLDAGPQLRVKITDFGLARAADDASLTQAGMIAGTPMYMAPEQARGSVLDHRTDLFSLGSVLYTLCTGLPPFKANSTIATLKQVVEEIPRPIPDVIPGVPTWLCEIIGHLQAKDADDRIATASEVAALLERGLKEQQRPGAFTWHPFPVPGEIEKPRPIEAQDSTSAARGRRLLNRPWTVAAGILLTLGAAFGATERSGITDFRGAVIRLFSPEVTLVVEIDDPSVSVKFDDSEIVITGAGAKEIRVKPGVHTLEATRDGKVVSRELVTVTKDGRQIVRVSTESLPPDQQVAKSAADEAEWERSLVDLPVLEQVRAVAARLKQLNPGFDGNVEPFLENGVVTGLTFLTDDVDNIAPLKAIKTLTKLDCSSTLGVRGKLRDLSPLKGMPLRVLNLNNSGVKDLSPLEDVPLSRLEIANTRVGNLSPLKNMKLHLLHAQCIPASDLSPLQGMPLEELDLYRTVGVTHLPPIKDLPLEYLNLAELHVSDLSILKGMATLETLVLHDMKQLSDLSPLVSLKLRLLDIRNSGVSDLTPIQGMSLESVMLTPRNITRGMASLREMTSVKTIGIDYGANERWPAAEFWTRYDAGEFTK